LIESESLKGVYLERGGEQVLCFSRADFLGLSQDKRVIHAIQSSLDKEGLILSGSLRQGGLRPVHRLFEGRFSAFKNSEDSLLCSSAETLYMSLCRSEFGSKRYALVSDTFPASYRQILQACDLSEVTFDPKEPESLEACYGANRDLLGAPVFVEGLVSSNGEIPPVARLFKVAEKNQSILLVDESHSTGVLGILGSGAIEKAGLAAKEILSITSFDKALGLIEVEVRKRSQLRTHALRVRESLRGMGFTLEGDPISPIIRLDAGSEKQNALLGKGLLERGFLTDLNFDKSLRILLTALHQEEDLVSFLQATEDVSRIVEVI